MSLWTLRRLNGDIIIEAVPLALALDAVRAELRKDIALRFKLCIAGRAS